jgi:hypothetical protein
MTDSIQTLDRHSSDLDRTPRLAASTGRSKGPVTVLFKAVVAWFVTSPAPRAYQPADGYPETSQARAARIRRVQEMVDELLAPQRPEDIQCTIARFWGAGF